MVNGKSRLRCCKAWVCCGESRSRVVVTNTIERFPDVVGRSVACDMFGNTFDTPDANSYLYNTRSELTSATASVDSAYRYGYDFDDIGNRKTSSERGTNATYAANNLNQYMSVDAFVPQYDADGNQTLVKTTTGTWQVTYNGENRPVRWELVSSNSNTPNSNTQTLLRMSFDRMGRRVTKNDQRFVYNGYLQICNYNSSTSTSHFNYYIWDPTEPVATRPLTWQCSALGTQHSTLFYTHDGNKNVSEVIASNNDVAAHYEYAPFGALTVSRGASAADNPWRFSSEYAEDDTATVYYNYRHYEPVTGRWMSRDPIGEHSYGHSNIYTMIKCIDGFDSLGLEEPPCAKNGVVISAFAYYEKMNKIGYENWATYLAWVLRSAGKEIVFNSANVLFFAIDANVGKCECIKELRVWAHGHSDRIKNPEEDSDDVYVEYGSGYENLLFESDTDEQISDFFGGLKSKFCEECHIDLSSCYVGSSPFLKDRIESKTGCSVTLYNGPLSPITGHDKPISSGPIGMPGLTP